MDGPKKGKRNCVLAFAGHMIDRPDRAHARFPAPTETMVRDAIREAVRQMAPLVAVCSAACGGDLIFAEEALAYGAELYLVLPFTDKNAFISQSVRYAGEQWVERFFAVLQRARLRPIAVKSGGYESDRDFENNQRAIIFFSLGFSVAHQLPLNCLALYDATQSGDGVGGTQSFIDLCENLNLSMQVIDMARLRTQDAIPFRSTTR